MNEDIRNIIEDLKRSLNMKIEYENGNKFSGFEFNPEFTIIRDGVKYTGCQVTRISPYDNQTNRIVLPINEEQYTKWCNGMLIQNAFPHLTVEEREFILTGLVDEQFEKFLGVGEEETVLEGED